MAKKIFLFAAIACCISQIRAQNSIAYGDQQNFKNLKGSGIMFTPNKGQVADMNGKFCADVLYKSEGNGADIYLRKTGVSYTYTNMGEVMYDVHEKVEELVKAGIITEAEEQAKQDELMKNESIKVHRVDMDFEGANPSTILLNEDEVEGYQNYYYSHCPEGVTNVHQYNKVTYKNIYNNIDIAFYGDKQNGIKYDLIVQPHADLGQIKLSWKGAESIYIKGKGNLVIKTSVNEFQESMPKVYQNINGRIIDVKAQYILNETTVSFDLGPWNHSFPLVIDPWISYYGGKDADLGVAVAADPSGNAVFTGYAGSVNFPVSAGAFQGAISVLSGVERDAYVVKMNVNGSRMWGTYYGGVGGQDDGTGITSDGFGNTYVTGTASSPGFPVGAVGANIVYQAAFNPCFLLKLDNAGLRLWATFYGSGTTQGTSVVTDGSNVYLYGVTKSNNNIATPGAFQTTLKGVMDVFVAKFTPTGSRVWATYAGGTGSEANGGIACDPASGAVYFVGITTSADFPVTAGAHQAVYGGGTSDGFLCKLNAAGSMLWATYYGGTADDGAHVVACDGTGSVIIAGETGSTNAIATAGAYQPALSGTPAPMGEIFIGKFNSVGTRQWGTYMGASNIREFVGGIATDASNNIYILGEWEETNTCSTPGYPVSPCAYQVACGGGIGWASEDDFIARYDSNGQQRCLTNIGGSTEDEIIGDNGWMNSASKISSSALAVWGNFLYFTCSTNGAYPVTAGAFQTTYDGGGFSYQDAIIGQLCINLCEAKILGLDYTANTTTVCVNAPVAFTPTVANTCDTSGYKFKWTFTGGNPTSSTAIKPVVTFPGAGTYSVKLVLTTACKKDSVTKNSYITVNSCGCIVSASTAVTANVNCSGGSNGSANVTISNGSGGSYNYAWSNGTSGTTTANVIPITGLSANTYTVTITDGSCVSISTVAITQALSATSITSANSTCNGINNGSATVTISAPAGTYTYNWSNGVNSITTSLSSQISNLAPATYTVTITRGGCSTTSTITLTQPQPLVMGTATQWSCSANTGTGNAYPTGGSAPYTYLWNTAQSTSIITGLSAGNYIVTVTDANACTVSQTIVVNAPTIVMNTVPTDISCFTTGAASFDGVVGGTGPYAYTWSTGQTGSTLNWRPGQVSDKISVFTAGVYTLTLTDATGCSTTRTFTINGTSTVVGTFTFPSPVCIGTSVTFTNTGNPPGAGVTYAWYLKNLPGSSPLYLANGITTTNLSYTFSAPGLYEINHLVKKSGCQSYITDYIKVINCSAPTVTATGNSVCPASCATVTAAGAGGTAPYVYSWSTGAATQSIYVCPASTTAYIVKVTDAGGATATTTATVTVNPAVTATTATTNINCYGGSNGSATANPGTGASPYAYVWTNGQTGQTATNLIAGNYTVTVIDAKGCSATAAATIISPSPFSGQFTKGTSTCAGCGCKGWVMVNAFGGTSPYTYTWPDGYVNRYKNQLCPGTYAVNIKDKNGCSINVNLITP
ncbi:MAG: SBBP repeat-containing protein [Bacteroidia bacterium]|nr:SBBP repeat-containing protein [Bacteroidia bacterium]